ncbi:MAG: DUF2778 domain-containing protein [Hyphomicrobiales bacterium]|nr:DUF2778 domain-containing protein [Hyphomicrobiales bacterium]
MTYASDITSFDEYVVPREQLRLFALGALLVGFTIVAAALALSALSATTALFASFTSTAELSSRAWYGRREPIADAKAPPATSTVAGAAPKASSDSGRTHSSASSVGPRTAPSTTTPRGSQPQAATATPKENHASVVALATIEAPVPPDAGPRLVPLPPRRPGDTPAVAEAPPGFELHPNKDVAHIPPADVKQRGATASAAATSQATVTAPPAVNAPSGGSVPAPDDRNPIQKLFSAINQATSSAFASRGEGQGGLAAVGARTALYDIQAHVVYLPNGEKLEAHSGLGNRFDDPRFVSEKNRGATPPNVYDLELRRDLFHGVAALRLNPVGSGNMFGRNGILAHSYMLGPRGDSNGCVSFRDYAKFLRAFQNGEVSRLAVVTHLGGDPTSVASSRN